jgi:hypothetical protein
MSLPKGSDKSKNENKGEYSIPSTALPKIKIFTSFLLRIILSKIPH